MRKQLFSALVLALSASPVFALDCGEGMRAFTHDAGEICIPANPQRIVALNDQILTLPLYEMGAIVVGSSGRIGSENQIFMRGGMDTLGIDFHNTDITFVGAGDALDLEAIAALEPDLIIALPYTNAGVIEKLAEIAPTPVIDETKLGFEGTLRALADLSGRSESFEARFGRYQASLERAKAFIGNPEQITIATIFSFTSGDKMTAYRTGLGAYTRVVDDLGFQLVDLVKDIDETRISLSPEVIQGLDADFIFGFYRFNDTASPEAIFGAYEVFVPGFCQALEACRNNQIVLLPSYTFGGTMKSLETALELIESHVAARRFVPLAE